jgi:alpha-L-fucosidase
MAYEGMTGAELQSMLKSSVNLKAGDGLKDDALTLSAEQIKWWRDAKIGFMFHWGLYSIPGRGEWTMHNDHIPADEYAKLADEFAPKAFDAAELAALALDAGARYSVMVTRHHDGFAMWDSPASAGGFTSYNTAAHRDFVREYTDAFRQAGLEVGLYYSLLDWRFNGYFHPTEDPESAQALKKEVYGQVEELMTRYGRIRILWYDGGWLAHKGTDADAAWLWEPIKLNLMARAHQPGIVINPRSGYDGDFKCDEGDGDIKGGILPMPWEKCFTCTRAWGYTPDEKSLPASRMIWHIANAAVRGGNTLINVAPDRDGRVPETVKKELREVGAWLRENGDAIYKTLGGPVEPVDGVYGFTTGGGRVFLHIFDAAAIAKERIPYPGRVRAIKTLRGEDVPFEQSPDGALTVRPDASVRGGVDTIAELLF